MRTTRTTVLIVLLTAAAPLSVWSTSEDRVLAGPTSAAISGTAYAIDGDTIRIEGEGKVRLQGVAAPEKNEQGGTEATDFMKRLVNGNDVRCELDGSRTYDRRVGVCFLEGRDIGAAVIAAGLARDCPRYSNGRYSDAEKPEAAGLPFPGYCKTQIFPDR